MGQSVDTLERHLQRTGVLQLEQGSARQRYDALRERLGALLDAVQARLAFDDGLRTQVRRQVDLLMKPFTIFVAGEFSKGKSSLINALCGNEAVRPVSLAPQDFKITVLAHGDPRENRTTKFVDVKHHSFDFLRSISLVDSPGINAALRPTHTDITREYVSAANLIVLVTSADRTVSEEEIELVRFISESNRSEIVFVFNKIDVFEDRLIGFQDVEGLQEMTRRLEEALTSQTDIRDPQIFALSARRALWAIQHDDEAVWDISRMGALIAYIGAMLADGRAWQAKLTRPLDYIEGRHVDGESILQGLLLRASRSVVEPRAAGEKVDDLSAAIDVHEAEIARAIEAFSVDDLEVEFDRSLDSFVDAISSPNMMRRLRSMRRDEQEKLVLAQLGERFEVWERGLASRVDSYIRGVVGRFEQCWDHCRQVVSSDARLSGLVEARRRQGVDTDDDTLDYRGRNADLIRQVERLAEAVHEESQTRFGGLMVEQGEALGSTEERLSRMGVGGLAIFPLAAVFADFLLTGGALTVASFATSLLAGLGTGGVAMWGLNARIDQLKKQMRERTAAQKARLVAQVRGQVTDRTAAVLRREAEKFVARCRAVFVVSLTSLVEAARSATLEEEATLEELLSVTTQLREEAAALAEALTSRRHDAREGDKAIPQPPARDSVPQEIEERNRG